MHRVINQVTLIGRLGNDPKSFGNKDRSGAKFNLATNETFGTGDDRRQKTDWHTIVCWGGLVKAAQVLTKGSLVAVAGKLRSNKFTDADGNDRWSVEVHASSIEFLDLKKAREADTDADTVPTAADEDEDDIPF